MVGNQQQVAVPFVPKTNSNASLGYIISIFLHKYYYYHQIAIWIEQQYNKLHHIQ